MRWPGPTSWTQAPGHETKKINGGSFHDVSIFTANPGVASSIPTCVVVGVLLVVVVGMVVLMVVVGLLAWN